MSHTYKHNPIKCYRFTFFLPYVYKINMERKYITEVYSGHKKNCMV